MLLTPQKRARELLEKIYYDVPVDLDKIARLLKLKIVYKELDDEVSGMLVMGKGDSIIVVNEDHSKKRQRFSISHEIGHFLLHRLNEGVFIDRAPIYFRDKASVGTIKEIEANAFAGELLMPESVIRKEIEKKSLSAFDDNTVEELAKKFDVSTQALTVRLMKLKLIQF